MILQDMVPPKCCIRGFISSKKPIYIWSQSRVICGMVIPLSTRNPYIPYLNPTVGLMILSPIWKQWELIDPSTLYRTHPNFGTSKFAICISPRKQCTIHQLAQLLSDHGIQEWAPVQPVGYEDVNVPNVTPTYPTSVICTVCCLLGLNHIYKRRGGPLTVGV